MGHHLSARTQYSDLIDRLNLFPQGVPESATLTRILALLFTEREAALMAKVPLKPFKVQKIAKIWGMGIGETERILDDLARRALVMDMSDEDGDRVYFLPPPIVGFFEFTLMRTRGDIDQKLLSELYHEYLVVEKDFVKDFFFATKTRVVRTFVYEDAVEQGAADSLEILDYESAIETLRRASAIGVCMCFCRHKAEHEGKRCTAPMDVCLAMNGSAKALAKHGHVRLIDFAEAQDVIQLSREHHLVHCGENVRREPSFICNCCGCCCELLQVSKRFGKFHPIETSNFIATIDADQCKKCGKCAKLCPIGAIRFKPGAAAKVSERVCLGCGVCRTSCAFSALKIVSRGKRLITPVNTAHRVILEAIEKGTLQNLIFDTQASASHRVMGTVLGAILKLPAVKAMLASEQLQSYFIKRLLRDKPLGGQSEAQ